MRDYLTVAEVLAMHADQIERYGGSHGVRDPGLLEAAPYWPQTGYYADPIEEAAALWESLAQNHAFIDGNKRTAFAARYTFLAVNGARLTADAQETYAFIAALYEANQFRFDKLMPWLRSHVTRGAVPPFLVQLLARRSRRTDLAGLPRDSWQPPNGHTVSDDTASKAAPSALPYRGTIGYHAARKRNV